MTIWAPDLERRDGPLYRAIAAALAGDVVAGRLAAGQQLPTHRDLARRLGVTVGTVTRGYAEAERQGYIDATVGRGTFVRAGSATAGVLSRPLPTGPALPGVIDLRSSYPALDPSPAAVADVLTAIARDPRTAELLRYQDHAGLMRHRALGALHMQRARLNVVPEQVLVTAGGQHAMTVAFLTIAQPGDVVLTEDLTYHGFKALAERLRLRLHGVAIDGEGLIPEAFEAACRTQAPRALYCMPTLHNPTAAVMGEARRARIAAIAAAHDVAIVEDDICGFAVPELRPLCAFAEGRAVYLTSVSKSMAPGLRLGFMAVPKGETRRFAEAIRLTTWMASPLTAEIVGRWIEDGTADRLVAAQRAELEARRLVAAEQLGPLMPPCRHATPHLWLALPAPWQADRFQAEALKAGVALTAGGAFAVGPNPPDCVRICIGAAATRADLAQAMAAIARLVPLPMTEPEASLSIL